MGAPPLGQAWHPNSAVFSYCVSGPVPAPGTPRLSPGPKAQRGETHEKWLINVIHAEVQQEENGSRGAFAKERRQHQRAVWGRGGVLRKRRTRHTLPRLAAAEDRHRGGDWRGVRTGRSEAFPWRVSRHRSVELVERDSRVLRQGRELRAAVAAADVLAPASGPQTLVPTGRRGQGRWRLHTAASQEGDPEPREPRSGKTGRKRFGLRPEGPASLRPKAAGCADVVGGTVGTRAVQPLLEGRAGDSHQRSTARRGRVTRVLGSVTQAGPSATRRRA